MAMPSSQPKTSLDHHGPQDTPLPPQASEAVGQPEANPVGAIQTQGSATATSGHKVKRYGQNREDTGAAQADLDVQVEGEGHRVTATAQKIRTIATDLAITQALQPDVQDQQGFSNADYPSAFVLLAMDDTRSLGQMLVLYPRQREAMGLSLEDVQHYLAYTTPEEGPRTHGAAKPPTEGEEGAFSGVNRSSALAALRETRTALRGHVGWRDLGDGRLLVNGVQLSSNTARVMNEVAGPRTSQGWFMDIANTRKMLAGLIRDRITVLNLDDLKAIAAKLPPDPVEEAKIEQAMKDPLLVTLKALPNGNTVGLVWDKPWDETGLKVKALVRDAGARWSGDAKTGWQMDAHSAQAVCLLLENEAHLDMSSALAVLEKTYGPVSPEAMAMVDEIQSGRMTVRVTHEDADNVWVVGRRKHTGLSDAIHSPSVGGRWDPAKSALRVPKAKIENLLQACDGMEDLDASSLFVTAQKTRQAHLAALENRVIISVPGETPGGMKLLSHQGPGVEFLLTAGWDHAEAKGGAILADDMGLGKTLELIHAANLKHPDGRFLVVTKMSLKLNWEIEVNKVLGPGQKIQVVREGKEPIDPEAKWVIMNYDLTDQMKEVLEDEEFDIAILDEAHYLANPEALRTKNLVGFDRKGAIPAAKLFADPLAAPGRKLMCVPSNLRGHLGREIGKALPPGQTVQVIKSAKEVPSLTADWVVCNHAYAEKNPGAFRDGGFAMIVGDDKKVYEMGARVGIRASRPFSPRAVEVKGILEAIPTVWAATGTPVQNRPAEMLSLLRAINHPLAKQPFQYLMKFCDGHQTAYGWEFKGLSNPDLLAREMASTYLRRKKSEVLNLPPKMCSPMVISLDPEAKRAYDKGLKAMLATTRFRNKVRGAVEETEVDTSEGSDTLVQLNALKQATALAKVQSTIEMAQEIVDAGNKVVIFSWYHECLDAFEQAFRGKCVRLDGGTSLKNRQQAVNLFQDRDSGVQVLIGQIKAAGEGITLTAAEDVLINDYPWTPGLIDQAEDRCYRIGTTGTVTVRYMEAEGTMDAMLRQILDTKRAIIASLDSNSKEAAAEAKAALEKGIIKELVAQLREQLAPA